MTQPVQRTQGGPGEAVRASVIVCTYNRADSLAETLDALIGQEVPGDLGWEIVVVDNNSRDHTREVVERKAAEFPRIRYEFEGRQGLSHARNHAIACARGDILLFTDDDVCPEPDWVRVVISSMDKYSCDACGGSIFPVWEKEPPDWLTERFHGFLAVRTGETEVKRITAAGAAPFGANMVVRKAVFDRVGHFDVRRGRVGQVLASGEDGELFSRILDAGFLVMFFPESRVHHKVEAFRVEKRYFRRWRYQTSRNLAESRGLPGRVRVFGIPPYILLQTARALFRSGVARMTLPSDAAFHAELIVWHFLGTLAGLWKTRRAPVVPG